MAPAQCEARRHAAAWAARGWRPIRDPAPNASASAAPPCRRRTARSGPRSSSVPRTVPAHHQDQECRPRRPPTPAAQGRPRQRRRHQTQRQAERHQRLRHRDHPRDMPADPQRAQADPMQPLDLDHRHRQLEEPGRDPDGQRGPDEIGQPRRRSRLDRSVLDAPGRLGRRPPQGTAERRRGEVGTLYVREGARRRVRSAQWSARGHRTRWHGGLGRCVMAR